MNPTTRSVLAALDRRFAEFGFARLSSQLKDRGYHRWINHEIRESIGPNLRIIAGVARLDSPQIGLRFESVENLVARFEEPNPALPAISPKDLASRVTMGFLAESQTVFAAFFRKTWNMWKLSEIEPAVNDFVEHVMKLATPFWDKYSDPEAALALLLRDDEEARDVTAGDDFRAERAVAMAFLRKGLDEARCVAEDKISKIRNESYREEFRGWMTRFFESQRPSVSS